MAEATARPRNCYCRDDAAHCGTCQVCGKPGHASHFPGPLPYTGSWCDVHYAVVYDRMEAAEDQSSPYGLRDVDRVYLHSPGRRRWFFWRGDSFLLEFRSQWLARYVTVAPCGKARWRHERWDHPISAWLSPLELMRTVDWQPATAEEFDQAWAAVR